MKGTRRSWSTKSTKQSSCRLLETEVRSRRTAEVCIRSSFNVCCCCYHGVFVELLAEGAGISLMLMPAHETLFLLLVQISPFLVLCLFVCCLLEAYYFLKRKWNIPGEKRGEVITDWGQGTEGWVTSQDMLYERRICFIFRKMKIFKWKKKCTQGQRTQILWEN